MAASGRTLPVGHEKWSSVLSPDEVYRAGSSAVLSSPVWERHRQIEERPEKQ